MAKRTKKRATKKRSDKRATFIISPELDDALQALADRGVFPPSVHKRRVARIRWLVFAFGPVYDRLQAAHKLAWENAQLLDSEVAPFARALRTFFESASPDYAGKFPDGRDLDLWRI